MGRPFDANGLSIFDEGYGAAETGAIGEIGIRGSCLARGYLGEPAMTAERFRPDPLGTSGERVYLTGDLAWALPDGSIRIIGRKDQEVKLRGLRINLADIEQIIENDPQIDRVFIVPDITLRGDMVLRAYIAVKSRDAALGTEALRRRIKNMLPEYMVPHSFHLIKEVPWLPNGKVDRLRIPDLVTCDLYVHSSSESGLEPSAHRQRIRENVEALWSQELGIPLSCNDNLFEVGGDSLTAVRIVMRLQLECAVELTVRDILENPTIKQLIGVIDRLVPAVGPVRSDLSAANS